MFFFQDAHIRVIFSRTYVIKEINPIIFY